MVATPDLFHQKLLNNPNARVILGLPGPAFSGAGGTARGALVAFVKQEIVAMAGGTAYTAPEAMFGGFSQMAQAVSNAAREMASTSTALFDTPGVRQFGIQSLRSTIENWTSCEQFKINLSLCFIAYDRAQDPRTPVKQLLRCVYPTFHESNWLIWAPNEYDGTDKNCISVQIGNWFSTPPIFLIRNVSSNISTIITNTGVPLYAEVDIMLAPYRMLSADDVTGFITDSVINNSQSVVSATQGRTVE